MSREVPPAFPVSHGTGSSYYANPGMSLRDWFAGQALAGFVSVPQLGAALQSMDRRGRDELDVVATAAYQLADAMLKARDS